MLVLTRKKGERVLIGDDIVVTVIDVRGDGVRIGLDAPRGIKIQRAEVVRAVSEANAEAAAAPAATADVLAGLLAARARPAAAGGGAPGAGRTVGEAPVEPGASAPRAPRPTPPRRRD